MLVVAGALLASPLVYVSVRLDAARQPSPALAADIARSNCTQLRKELESIMVGAGSDLDFSGRRAETVRRIVRRGEQLDCRPTIRSPYG